jgi:hypothetical protein
MVKNETKRKYQLPMSPCPSTSINRCSGESTFPRLSERESKAGVRTVRNITTSDEGDLATPKVFSRGYLLPHLHPLDCVADREGRWCVGHVCKGKR